MPFPQRSQWYCRRRLCTSFGEADGSRQDEQSMYQSQTMVGAEADDAMYIYRNCGCTSKSSTRVSTVRNSTIRSSEEVSSTKRTDYSLMKEVTVVSSFLRGCEQMRGRSQVTFLYQQLPASNLCPASNGSDRCLYSSSNGLNSGRSGASLFARSRGTPRELSYAGKTMGLLVS